jgi:hypothetical protein
MIEQIPAASAYPVFRNPVLPWTSEAGALGLNAKTLHCFDHFIIELWVAIKDQVAGSRVIGKRLAQLLNDPCTRRMASHLTLRDAPPVMRDDEKAVEHSEGQPWRSKEIHRDDGFPMIAEKSCPSLGWLGIPPRSPHPAQRGSLVKIEAKHFQFAVDARCAPCGIFRDHVKDKIAQFLADAFSARPNSVLQDPRPIQLEPARCTARITAHLHSGQKRRKITQNSLSEVETCLRGYRCFITTSCLRRAKFSSSRSRRKRKIRIRKELRRHQHEVSIIRGQTMLGRSATSLI